MAKTIADYKKDYEAAKKRGDAAGMQAANDGANAIRRQQGVKEEHATQDIANVANRNPGYNKPSSGGYNQGSQGAIWNKPSSSSSGNSRGEDRDPPKTGGGYVRPGTSAPGQQQTQKPQNQEPQEPQEQKPQIGALYHSNVGGQWLTYDKYGNVYAVGNTSNRQRLTPDMVNDGTLKAIGSVNDFVTDQYRDQLAHIQRKDPNAKLGSYLTGIGENDMDAAYTHAGNNYVPTDYGKAIQQAKEDWEEARRRGDQAAMDEAHRMAEIARQLHGYTGGADGSKNDMMFVRPEDVLDGITGGSSRTEYIEEMQRYLKSGGLYGNGIKNDLGTNTGRNANNGAAVTILDRKHLSEGTKGTMTMNGTTYYRMDTDDAAGNPTYMNPATGKMYSGVLNESGKMDLIQTGQVPPRLVMSTFYGGTPSTGKSPSGTTVTGGGTKPSSPGGPSSAPSTGGSSWPNLGSVSGIQVNTPDQEAIRDQMAQNSQAWHNATSQAEKDRLQKENQYLAGLLGGNITFNPGTGTWSGSASSGEVTPQSGMEAPDLKELLDAWREAALGQQNNQIDQAVDKAVTDLERALEDAQPQFREQQEQIARDEMQALDNSALYSELRGDKGGIGKEQYSSIQNTAAQNQLAVAQAQTKLATDTARQIADLRAQGEFQKADAALEVAQAYLSQLISIQQWAAEYNLSAAQFQESIRQWEAEFKQSMDQFNANLELSKAEITGAFADGTPTLAAKDRLQQQLASIGESLLAAGVMPSSDQLAAMGMTKDQASAYIQAARMESMRKSSGGSGGGNGGGKDTGTGLDYDGLFAAALDAANRGYDPETFINNSYKKYGFSDKSGLIDEYENWLARRNNTGDEWEGIDKRSVTALGMGPMTRAKLEELVDNGQVEAYKDPSTGLIKVKRARSSTGGSSAPQRNPFAPFF